MKRVTQPNERHPVCHNWINFSWGLDAWLPRKEIKNPPYSAGVIRVALSAPHRPHSPPISFPFCSNEPSATIQILEWAFWVCIFSPYIYIKNERDLIHRPKPLVMFLSLRLRSGWSERFRKAGAGISGFWCWERVPGMARPDRLGSSQKTQAGLRDNRNLPGKRKRKEKRTKKEDI